MVIHTHLLNAGRLECEATSINQYLQGGLSEWTSAETDESKLGFSLSINCQNV